MTTPGGVPNLPVGALTVDTLAYRLQNQSPSAMRQRARDQMPGIFDLSTGGNIMSDLSPFGIITAIWAQVNSLIAEADPADITSPDDIPALLVDFIESLPLVGPIFEVFNLLLQALTGEYEGDNELALLLQSLIAPMWQFLSYVFGGFLTDPNSFLKPVFEFIDWFWNGDGIEGGFPGVGTIIGTTLKPLITLVIDVFETIGKIVLEAIAALFGAVAGLIDIPTLQALIEDVAGFLAPILDPQRFTELLKAVTKILVNVFDGMNLAGIVQLVTDILSYLINFFRNTIDAGTATLSGLFDAAKGFLGNIPLVGTLLGLAGNDTLNGKPIATISDLITWFQTKVLTVNSSIPAANLTGTIPRKLLGSIGVGNVDDTTPNQVDLNSFPEAAVMQVGGRWSWDGTQSRTSGSGAAKVTCASSSARMYSNKIPVAAGQLLSLSAWVKWSGLSNSTLLSSPISIGVRTYYQGNVQQVFSEVASVPTIGLSANSEWVEVKNLIAWTVPAGVNEVRMSIGVNASATAGTVWFDDVALRKTNNLAQNLVTDLPSAFNGVIDGLFGNPQGTSTLTSASGSQTYTAASGTQSTAATASTTASGAAVTAQDTVNGVNAAVGNNTAAGQPGSSVLTALQNFNNHLFGIGNNRPGTSFASGRIPELDGSIIKTGSVGSARLPLTTILPTSGSGAIMTRRNTKNFVHDINRHMFWVTQITRSENNLGGTEQRSPFFTDLDVASTDIQVLRRTSDGDLLGIYKATYAGWYTVELSFRLDPAFTAGYCFAPLLYRSEDLRTLNSTETGSVDYSPADTRGGTGVNLIPYKIGADALLSPPHFGIPPPTHDGARYAQCTWVIYLPAGGAVAAGYDARYGALGTVDAPIDADASGIETYFSIAALSKTAA